LAAVTTTATMSPSVSTSIGRLRPLMFCSRQSQCLCLGSLPCYAGYRRSRRTAREDGLGSGVPTGAACP
jgi:hypothetical protein